METVATTGLGASCTFYSECATCQQQVQDISCFRKIAGVLSSEEVKKHKLIVQPVERNFSPTVYDLSLGNFHYVYEIGDDGKAKRTPVCIGSAKAQREEEAIAGDKFKQQVGTTNRSELRIPALGAALIQLNEIIDTLTIVQDPDVILVTGRFDLKLSLVNRGLVSQQGTQIEPCYKGRLYCFVHNFSSEDIILNRGQKIASLEFSYVSCICNYEKRKTVRDQMISNNMERYKADEYCDPGKGILNVRYFSSRPDIKLPEACGLLSASIKAVKEAKEAVLQEEVSNKIRDSVVNIVEPQINERLRKSSTFLELLKVIIPAVALIIGAIIAGYFGYVKPVTDANQSYRQQIDAYQQSVDIYLNEIKALEERLGDLENTLNEENTSKSDVSNKQPNP